MRPRGASATHGYNFEIPVGAEDEVDPVPLLAMGRFVHEAVAVDPRTFIVYETEDRGDSGFYRFIPNQPANLPAGGRLQMLAVKDRPNYNTSAGQRVGRPLPVGWVDIADPDPAAAETNPSAVFQQGLSGGSAIFSRLEGCWYGDGSIFFHASDGGDAGLGQVWQYTPRGASGGQLRLLFESPSADVLDSPDNITVSPRGGIVICEDGDDTQFMRGLTQRGQIFDFCLNIVNDREFAGACFSPDGETLFVNIQGDTRSGGPGNLGMTFAIWGPGRRAPCSPRGRPGVHRWSHEVHRSATSPRAATAILAAWPRPPHPPRSVSGVGAPPSAGASCAWPMGPCRRPAARADARRRLTRRASSRAGAGAFGSPSRPRPPARPRPLAAESGAHGPARPCGPRDPRSPG